MLVSHEHRFIFVHVPKTAGLSVAAAFDPFRHRAEDLVVNRALSQLGINVNHFGPLPWRRIRIHATADQIRRVLGAKVFDSYFKFAFVRNPWDRMVSYYHYIQSRESHHRGRKVRELSFADYLEYEGRRNKVGQWAILSDKRGRLLMDRVGRFESLADDFREIADQLGVTAELPHRNATKHAAYQTYYDDETRQIVSHYWADEIEQFGYAFDDSLSRAA